MTDGGRTLQLTRVRVEQVRQFRQPFELAGLTPGINLFAGPNEAGKSTLVRAIRAAFFERHRSTQVEDLRPWGDGAATPSITLDFLLEGQPHQLHKSFLGKKRCTLSWGTSPIRSLEGAEAEDHLARQFGFAFAGRGESKPEHWGIPGLLWVEQGTGQDLEVRHAREHLHDALQGLTQEADRAAGQAAPAGVGAASHGLAATVGDAVLERLRSQRAELLTSSGKSRGALAEAAADQARWASELAALELQLQAYRQQVDQLAWLREAHAQEALERPWESLRVQLGAAREAEQALAQQQKALTEDRQRCTQAAQALQLRQDQLQAFVRQEEEADRRQRALAGATEGLAAAEAAVAAAQRAAEPVRAQAQAAVVALSAAREADLRKRLTQQVAEAQAVAARDAQALARAEAEATRVDALRQQSTAQAISPAAVAALRPLERQLRELAVQREALATRVSYQLLPGAVLTLTAQSHGVAVAGEAVIGEGTFLLDGPATLELPGLGLLAIAPGAEQDLGSLERRFAQAQSTLQAALAALACIDLAEAEARLARHTDLRNQLALAEQALGLVAPQGLDALRQATREAHARAASDAAALDRLTPLSAVPVVPSLAGLAGEVLSLAAAEASLKRIQAMEDQARQTLGEAQQRHAAAQSRHAECLREASQAAAALAEPERMQRQAEARSQWLAQQEERAALAARIDQRETLLAQARPDIVAQDIQRLQRSVDEALAQHQQRREQIAALDAALQGAGAQGLDERRERAAGEQARAAQRLDQLQRRADALALLCQMLEARRTATLQRLQAPLQQHLQRYLPLLFPGAQLSMDEQLAPSLLSRPAKAGGALATQSGAFDALSFGAREQLALLARFAYADLLREAGRPTLLILDDALVHSDATRLAQMKRVLFDAAQRHQVLLFTCHPEAWRDLGVAPRAIAVAP